MTDLNRRQRRRQEQARRRLKVGQLDAPFVRMPEADIAAARTRPPYLCERVMTNGALIVFVCAYPGDLVLLMIQRYDGRDGLSWDDLQRTKEVLGFGDREAVEMYPRECDVVNVANMRHLWVFPEGLILPFGLEARRRLGGLEGGLVRPA